MIKFLNPCLNIQKNMINFEKKFKLFKLLKKNKKKRDKIDEKTI